MATNLLSSYPQFIIIHRSRKANSPLIFSVFFFFFFLLVLVLVRSREARVSIFKCTYCVFRRLDLILICFCPPKEIDSGRFAAFETTS